LSGASRRRAPVTAVGGRRRSPAPRRVAGSRSTANLQRVPPAKPTHRPTCVWTESASHATRRRPMSIAGLTVNAMGAPYSHPFTVRRQKEPGRAITSSNTTSLKIQYAFAHARRRGSPSESGRVTSRNVPFQGPFIWFRGTDGGLRSRGRWATDRARSRLPRRRHQHHRALRLRRIIVRNHRRERLTTVRLERDAQR